MAKPFLSETFLIKFNPITWNFLFNVIHCTKTSHKYVLPLQVRYRGHILLFAKHDWTISPQSLPVTPNMFLERSICKLCSTQLHIWNDLLKHHFHLSGNNMIEYYRILSQKNQLQITKYFSCNHNWHKYFSPTFAYLIKSMSGHLQISY